MSTFPKVFISYSHDTQQHKRWVLELATRLRNSGIDAIIDQFELKGGDDVPHFMETNLISSHKILMVCTEKYVEKANAGDGGVGFEKMIVTATAMQKISESKVIPIIRQSYTSEVPTFLKSKLYINFSKDDDFEYSYDELARAIKGETLFVKPEITNKPFATIERVKLEDDSQLIKSIMAGILNYYDARQEVYASGVNRKVGISRILFELKLDKLKSMELIKLISVGNDSNIILTEKGKKYAIDNNLI